MTQAERLRSMLWKQDIIVAPGVHDAIAARAAQQCGFEAVYMTGNGSMASLIGRPDIGIATMSEMVIRAKQISDCLDIPVISDADTGYGGTANLRRTVEEFERAGIAAIHIEDQQFPKRCGALGGIIVVPEEEAFRRIKTACDARKSENIVVIARTDACLAEGEGIESALRRISLFERAGADVVMVEGLQNIDEIRKVVSASRIPVLYNIYEDKPEHAYSVEELKSAGVKIVINCLTSALMTAKMMVKLYSTFMQTGTTKAFYEELLPMDDYVELLGIDMEMCKED